MIQYPKHEHVTLPSVESWGTNMNILRDPPKSLFTRRIDKVSATQEITRMVGENSGDRICEMIKVYPRGINPHVSVSYSNYGTNGGQNRQTNGWAARGNKICCDGRSVVGGQAKLPYRILNYGSFRPPVFRQEELLPLSRLPRTNTKAWTQKGFINYAASKSCAPKKMRQVHEEPIRTSVRPTAIITIGQHLVEPFEIRQVIENPIRTSAYSGTGTRDITQKKNSDINGRVQDKLRGNITTNIDAPRGTGIIKNLDPAKFIANVKYSTVIPNKRVQKTLQIENLNGELPVKDVINFPTTSGFSRPNSEPLKSNLPYELKRLVPQHELNTSKGRNIYIRKEVDNKYNFKRNLPLTSAGTSKGLNYGRDCFAGLPRDKKLKRKIRPTDGFEGKATVPKYNQRTNVVQFSRNPNKIDILHNVNRNQGTRVY
jgi:hypothetical protein